MSLFKVGAWSVLLPCIALATQPYPYSSRYKQQVQNEFFENGMLSPAKILAYRRKAQTRHNELGLILKNHYLKRKGETRSNTVRKILANKLIKGHRIWLRMIDELRRLRNPVFAFPLIHKILELDLSIRVEGDRLPSTRTFTYLSTYFDTWKIYRNKAPLGQASNLMDPASGEYYTQAELQQMTANGFDISLLDPPPRTAFWSKTDIPNVDVRLSNHFGGDDLHHGTQIEFPSEGQFHQVRTTQSKPKLDVTFIDSKGQKQKVKLKLGVEIHSDPTISALLTAIGYSADALKYVRDFKVYFKNETEIREFRRAWASYYEKYDVDDYIRAKATDAKGLHLIFWEGMLEAKPKDHLRIGPWGYGDNDHKSLREVRGLLLFNMWVANADLKEAENNKLILREKNNKVIFNQIQHDNGFAFGYLFREKPGDYRWRLIDKKTSDYLKFDFFSFQHNSGFDHVAWADAKWMVRKIAQLSRMQIEHAVDHGGWPAAMGQLLVEKLISRRNDLIKAFEMEGERLPNGYTISLLPFDRKYTSSDGVVTDGELIKNELPGYTQDFGNSSALGWRPVLNWLRDNAIKGTRNYLSSIDHIALNPQAIGFREGFVSEIIFGIRRSVDRNPTPEGDFDQYLVKDEFTIGFRFGFELVGGGDVAYVKRFTLVYPVKTEIEGSVHDNFIYNLLLPYHVIKDSLPEKYVLMREDYVEGRGTINLETPLEPIPIGSETSFSRIYLSRNIFDKRHKDKLVMYNDSTVYNEFAQRLYLHMLRIRFPFFTAAIRAGSLAGEAYIVDVNQARAHAPTSEEISKAISIGDFSGVGRLAEKVKLDVDFSETEGRVSLFGLLVWNSRTRVDQIQLTRNRTKQKMVQYQSDQLQSWQFFDNGESHRVKMSAYAHVPGNNQPVAQPLIHLKYFVKDLNTHSEELKDSYIGFLNRIAGQANFIRFTPKIHSSNNYWGNIRVHGNLFYYPEALERLLELGSSRHPSVEQAFLGRMATELGITRDRLTLYFQRARWKQMRDTIPPRVYYYIEQTRLLFERIARARRASPQGLTQDGLIDLTDAIRGAAIKKGESFDPMLIAGLNEVAGYDNLFINAIITMPEHSEKKLLARKDIYGERGQMRNHFLTNFTFLSYDAAEFYHMFDYLIKGPITVKSVSRDIN